MTFRDLSLHLEYCNCDLFEVEGGYMVTETLSRRFSFLPTSEVYYPLLVVKLCRTLKIECPQCYEDDYHVYEAFEKKQNRDV